MAVNARAVARLAGVSVSTVSRAISRPDDVAPETRAKVLEAARAMGYYPNVAARSPNAGRAGALGLIVPDIENPFFSSLTKGVQARASATGYALMMADSDEDPSRELDLGQNMARKVDGIILCAPRSSDAAIRQLGTQSPVVLVNRQCGEMPAILIDYVEGVRLALEHLRALGHRKVAYAGGPARSWSNRARLEAVHVMVDGHPDTELVELGSFQPTPSGGVAAADLVIASGATAVLAYNDLVAFGLLYQLGHRGIRVPGDVSVVGMDNVPMAALTFPTLTSVGIPLTACGKAVVDLLVARLREPDRTTSHSHDLSFQLVVRNSTGPCLPG